MICHTALLVPVVLLVVLAWPTYHVRNEMLTTFGDHPWALIFPLLATAALIGMRLYQSREAWLNAFAASGLFIVGLLTTMAAGLYPNVLPARQGQPHSLGVTITRKTMFLHPELFQQVVAAVMIAGASHGTTVCRGLDTTYYGCDEIAPGTACASSLNRRRKSMASRFSLPPY